jgi:serine/threonine protein phosphatase PrpC
MITTATAKGSRRYQEDHYFVSTFVDGTLIGVMDGHNGAAVSALLVDLFPKLWSEVRKTENNYETVLLEVFKRAADMTKFYGEGSTASLAFIWSWKGQQYATIAVLGDSPVIGESEGGRYSTCIWIGPDHNARSNPEERSLAIQRGGIYDRGYIWNDLGDMGSGLQMTRALGDVALDRILDRTPEVFTIGLGLFLLIGSDGLFDPTHADGKASYDDVLACIRNGGTADSIVQQAVAVPTNDNVTAVLWRQEEQKS